MGGTYDPATFGPMLAELAGRIRDPRDWTWALRTLPEPVRRRIAEEWRWQAHGGQEPPIGDWRIWLIMAGRGFGKTRAGAEWIADRARAHPGARIALVGGSRDDVIKVMVEGPSGLLCTARSDEHFLWVPTRGELVFPSGARGTIYSAAAPGQLRGPEHDFAWADELAKWAQAEETWHNLNMGLRRGGHPQLVVTTTPAPVPALLKVRAAKNKVETGGRTADNAHLTDAYRDWVEETYAGTRLGRQELEGELIEDVEGSLFPREVIERARHPDIARSETALVRVVVGVDPPASAGGDACGIVVCGLCADGTAYVLADCSVAGERPEGWARSVARAAEAWTADRVIAEKNQGGDMVESVLRQADCALPVRLVSASRGKSARAEPVAARMEAGRVRLAGAFPELEDELAGLTVGGAYRGPAGSRSPDRADAAVWALTELIRPRAEPRVLSW